MNNSTLIALQIAKGTIITRGWRQGPLENPTGGAPTGCCTTDVMFHLLAPTDILIGAIRTLEEAFLALNPDAPPVISLPDWNDQPGRTVEEVYALYDKAIEIAAGSLTMTDKLKAENE